MIVEKINPVKSPSLYSLTTELSDAIAEISVDESTGEVVGFEKVDALAFDTETKLVNCARAVRNIDLLLDQMEQARKELSARMKCYKNISDRLKDRCVDAMRVLEIKAIKDVDIELKTRRSESVEIIDESLISEEFMVEKVVKTPSKTAIKQAIKSGIDVKGAQIVENQTLQIKG